MMFELPDRLAPLGAKLEQGGKITIDDLNRINVLIAFDLAELQRQSVMGAAQAQENADAEIRNQFNAT